jgi:hypothetical protein
MRDAIFLRAIAQESLRLAKAADGPTASALLGWADRYEAEALALDMAEAEALVPRRKSHRN